MPNLPNPFLTLEPKLSKPGIAIKDSRKVIITKSDTGSERRELIWTRDALELVLKFRNSRTGIRLNTLWDFWKARNGEFTPFFIPTWMGDTELTAAANAGTTSLSVLDNTVFSATAGRRGNWLAVRSRDTVEGALISALPNSTTITLNTALDSSFRSGDVVDILLFVRFGGDFSGGWPVRRIAEVDISFVELPEEYPTSL